MNDRTGVRTHRHDAELRFGGKRHSLDDELAAKPGAPAFGRDFDIVDVHHANLGPAELEEP